MADEQTPNWGSITARNVERLRKQKIPAVPAEIVALAQASYDDKAVKSYEFRKSVDLKIVEQFCKHLKNAGHHTDPKTSVSVVPDPDDTGNKHLVNWKAGGRRGASSA